MQTYASTDHPKLQILSLGAGYDTTYFWIQDQIANGSLPESLKDRIVFVEVDYFDVVSKKIQIIKQNEALHSKVKDINEESQFVLNSSQYKIIAADLRETEKLAEKFNQIRVDPQAPTFMLTECVLVYLKPDESNKILHFLRDYFPGDLALLNYEMINP